LLGKRPVASGNQFEIAWLAVRRGQYPRQAVLTQLTKDPAARGHNACPVRHDDADPWFGAYKRRLLAHCARKERAADERVEDNVLTS
jgi:hypothetical protein